MWLKKILIVIVGVMCFVEVAKSDNKSEDNTARFFGLQYDKNNNDKNNKNDNYVSTDAKTYNGVKSDKKADDNTARFFGLQYDANDNYVSADATPYNSATKPYNGVGKDDKKTKVSCRESRASLEGKACCDLPATVAKWDGKSCVCLDKNQEFQIQNDHGVCVAKNQPVAKDKCDCSNALKIVSNAWAKCGMENSAIADAAREINIQCNSGTNCNAGVLNQNINIVNIAIANCESEQSHVALKRVQSAVDALENDIRGLDRSVWKNADGNFNTARLASDSIAGVVLGTAGGIITANVVKKNQLENGFDDIVCTINGQTVGGYGDEIIVGVQ